MDSDTQGHLKKLIQIKSQEFEQLQRATGSPVDGTDQDIYLTKGEILMNRRTEMGGVRVERTQYRRWGGN